MYRGREFVVKVLGAAARPRGVHPARRVRVVLVQRAALAAAHRLLLLFLQPDLLLQPEDDPVEVAVLLLAFLAMLAAGPILRVIQESGAAIVSRVMGMILAAVAVDNIIAAVFVLIAEGPV